MKRCSLILLGILSQMVFVMTSASATDPPADRVLALYFHRTERCPTCLKMGTYAEKAVTQGFAAQLKEGTVSFRHIDFQEAKNARLTKAYKVKGPALIIIKVVDNKVQEYKNLNDIWTKVRGEESEFLQYVRDNVDAYLNKS